MNLVQLRHFVALADTSNFHRAAELLGVSQPQVSIGLRKLEEELGLTLFDRSRWHVELSDAGRALLADARQAVLHADLFRAAAREALEGRRGLLRIAFIGSATYDLLPRLLRAYRAQYPDVEIELDESRTIDILSKLNARDIDVGIIRLPVFDAADVAFDMVDRNEWLVAVSVEGAFAGLTEVELRELAKEPFVVFSREAVPNLHAMTIMLCSEAGFQPRILQQAVQLQTVLSIVAGGLGIALVPSNVASTTVPGVHFLHLKNQQNAPQIGMGIAVSAEPVSAAARNFRKLALALGQHSEAAEPNRG